MVYNYQRDPVHAEYVGYTSRHLQQCIDEHYHSAGKETKPKHTIRHHPGKILIFYNACVQVVFYYDFHAITSTGNIIGSHIGDMCYRLDDYELERACLSIYCI